MTKTAAIYARVSSDRQKESGTIASQMAALREFAREREYIVPPEWVFEDDGFSGARLDRPGLEAVRDLAAEGRIEAVLVLSPDRLSRKYAYQVLLLEEFARCGVRVRGVAAGRDAAGAPAGLGAGHDRRVRAGADRGAIPARQAVQGAERVAERALGSTVRVPVREAERGVEARYEVLSGEAEVVRQVFDSYTRDQCSMGAIARRLTEQGIPTRTGKGRWDRSVIWAILRNPAYRGRACYGKTGTGRGRGSRGPCGSPASSRGGRWAGLSVRARSGSRFRCRPW